MKKITLFNFLFFCTVLFAQTAPDTLWTKTFGGLNSEYANTVIQTNDGGFIIAGSTESIGAGSFDAWLIKIDENGNEEWNQTYGGSEWDKAMSIIQLSDGCFIVAGYTYSFNANYSDFWLFKIDQSGNLLWNRIYGGNDADIAYSVIQTNDNGFAIIGKTQSFGAGNFDAWLVKTDLHGIEEWNQTYGGINSDYANSIQQTSDNGFIIAGDTSSFGLGYEDGWLIKIDVSGNEEWNQTYGDWNRDEARSVIITDDGGYIFTGISSSYSPGVGDLDFWLVKTDVNGNEEWNETYGGLQDDRAHSVIQTIDSGFMVAGGSESYGAGSSDFWLLKTDNFGNELWSKAIGEAGLERSYSLISAQNTFILAGFIRDYDTENYDIWLVCVDSDFKSRFSANPLNSFINHEINFYDESIGNPISWAWDFENDGVYDSFVQHPTHIYNAEGVHSVKLKISNETYVDSLIKENYISVTYCPPASPQNINVEVIQPDAVISWSAVDTTDCGDGITPDGYIIQFSENGEDYFFLNYTTNINYVHTFVAQFSSQMFYKVIAFKYYSRYQIEYLEKLNNSKEKVKWSEVKQNLTHMRE